MDAVGLDSTPNPHRPIPQAVLKLQFKRLLSQHSENSVIFTRDLLAVIDQYETEHDVVLLTPDQKDAIRPYCLANPDLEMSADDVLNLLKLVFPQTTRSTGERPGSVRQNSACLDESSQNSVKQEHQQEDDNHDRPEPSVNEPMDIVSHTVDSEQEDDVDKNSVAQYYRRSIELTRRLKISERSLASMTRDNEDRIVQLQNRVDDMNQEVVKQRREISEYKNKEKNSLEQISTLEAHIARIERSESAQKQVYQSIRKLFDEKCQETQELQEMLRRKEKELENTEALLSAVHREFQQLYDERNRLMKLQQELERELATSHYTHMQLAEQRSENERLKGIIDGLKCDLESRNEVQDGVVPGDNETYALVNTLQAELESHIGYSEPYLDTEERLKSVEYEKDYYKTRANEAMEDLDRVNQELASLKRALEQENKSLVNQLADLQTKMPVENKENLGFSSSHEAGLVGFPFGSNDTTIEMDDVWTQSRLRQRKFDKGRKRGVQDLNESTANMIHTESDGNDTRVVARSNDRAVTNTATFAIYTLLVYIFGIVTSTFLLETAQPGSWEQALVAAAAQQGSSRSKILEIIIYWIEKLLFEGDGMSLS